MKSLVVRFIGGWLLAATALLTALSPAAARPAQAPAGAIDESIPVFPEGRDYATLSLRRSWDMNEYAEISQGINLSGQLNLLDDIKVEDSVFSAKSTNLSDAQYYQLWPGYETAVLHGKVGHNYPIDSSVYHCLYIAMRVESQAVNYGGTSGPDALQIFWFADEKLNGPGGVWGFSKGIVLYPEAYSATPSPLWKLYKIDLATEATYWQGARWTDSPTWQALRIDPTIQPGIDFAIDWVRLTDCSPVSNPVSWGGYDDDGAVYVRRDGTDRDIQVEANAEGFYYNLDLQGLAPGTYTYYVRHEGQTLGTGRFQVNATPIVEFLQPAFGKEDDFATEAGNPWDFSGPDDVRMISGMDYQFVDGVLDLVTPSTNNPDPVVLLNMPAELPNPEDYHYLSFRIYTEGPYQNVPYGFIIRWVWEIPGAVHGRGFGCYFASQDIPFDVGWQTYTIDLNDAFNGHAEQHTGDCEGYSLDWQNDKPIVQLRFDPNENMTGVTMHQQIDWIRLTKADYIKKGDPVPVQVMLNKAAYNLTDIIWFYTTDPNPTTQQLTQIAAATQKQAAPQTLFSLAEAPNRLFLPVLGRTWIKRDPPPANALDFDWDTTSVTPGEYYLCARVSDAYNTATYCSDAPITVME